jgi:hypothetical protein
MFDLELAIAVWRHRMLATGIASDALDELEGHLREEIGKQLQSNQNIHESFEMAIDKLGTPGELKTEFRKNHWLMKGFTFRRFATLPGILAVLWLVSCGHDLMVTACWWFHPPQWAPHFDLPLGLTNILINGAGCAGCLLLLAGSELGVRILRSVALLYLIICLVQCIPNLGQTTDWRIWCGIFATFSLLTIWLLHRPPKQTVAA